jgi:hypothetical protein
MRRPIVRNTRAPFGDGKSPWFDCCRVAAAASRKRRYLG